MTKDEAVRNENWDGRATLVELEDEVVVITDVEDAVPVPLMEPEAEVEVWLSEAVGKVTICVDSEAVPVRVELTDPVTEAVLLSVDWVPDSVRDTVCEAVPVSLVAEAVLVTDAVADAVFVLEPEAVTDSEAVKEPVDDSEAD